MLSDLIPGNDDAIRSVKLIASAIADAVIEAKEGVSAVVKPKEVEEEEVVDLKAVLAEVKPNIELAEAKDEEKKPVKKKKTAKKPANKEVVDDDKTKKADKVVKEEE